MSSSVLTFLIDIVSFIVVFGLLVFVHEFGHFITAKLSGVKVREFALGMGPAYFKKQGKETLYALRVFPIGGYCDMEEDNGPSDDPKSFSNKKPIFRLIILAAGAFMNFILAYVLLVIVMFGVGFATNTLKDVVEDYPAAVAGIEAGDTIVAVDGFNTPEWQDIVDRINESKGQTLTITVERNGQTLNYDVTPQNDSGAYKLGIETKTEKRIGSAFVDAGKQFWIFMTSLIGFLVNLIGPGKVEGEVVGPVGLFQTVGKASQQGIMTLIFLASYISVNLGIVNLLPFPALDGGRIIFVLIEMIKGSPVDPKKEGYVHGAGFMVLIALMIFLVFRDISHL